MTDNEKNLIDNDEDFDLDYDVDDDSDFEDTDLESDESDEPDDESDGKSDDKSEIIDTSVEDKEQKPSQQKDKITHALLKQKMVNKELKAKLERLEQKSKEAESEARKKVIVDKLIDKGYDDEEAQVEAEKQLENENMKRTVKKLEFLTENADILAKYPDARKNVDKLIKLQKSTGWSLEKICRVEFSVNENAFDKKVKSDQEDRLKQKRKLPSTPVGGQTPTQGIKFDSDDEKAYQFYAKRNPGVSRKQYSERLIGASKQNRQNIAHDKWD